MKFSNLTSSSTKSGFLCIFVCISSSLTSCKVDKAQASDFSSNFSQSALRADARFSKHLSALKGVVHKVQDAALEADTRRKEDDHLYGLQEPRVFVKGAPSQNVAARAAALREFLLASSGPGVAGSPRWATVEQFFESRHAQWWKKSSMTISGTRRMVRLF